MLIHIYFTLIQVLTHLCGFVCLVPTHLCLRRSGTKRILVEMFYRLNKQMTRKQCNSKFSHESDTNFQLLSDFERSKPDKVADFSDDLSTPVGVVTSKQIGNKMTSIPNQQLCTMMGYDSIAEFQEARTAQWLGYETSNASKKSPPPPEKHSCH